MFVNLSAVMLRLCEPFLDANSTKKDKIDPKYVFYGSRLDFKELTALHASSEEVTEWLNKNNPNSASSSGQQSQYESTNYSFICECLFMTTRVLNLGLLKAFSDFKHLVQVIIQITKKPGRDIPIGLVGSMLIVITTYSLLATVLCLMQPYNQIDVDAPFTIAFEVVGMNWAKILVGLGALKGMTTVLLATIIAESRYFTHIARTHMAPPILAVVHKKLGTPVNAAIIMTAANCLVAFFTSLDVLASLLSISTLFIFSLVAIGLLVRRYYSTGVTTDGDRNKLIMLLVVIVSSSMGLALLWAWGVNSLAVYLIVVGIWFLSTLGIRLMVKQARNPRLWGAPLVPWLPSCSIALNLFMMGSIDGASFLRFMVWTMVLLTYYFLVGLHATYDASKESIKMGDDDEVERGNAGDRASTASEAVELNTITTSHT